MLVFKLSRTSAGLHSHDQSVEMETVMQEFTGGGGGGGGGNI